MPNWTDKKVENELLILPTLIACDRIPNVVNNDAARTFKSCISRKEVAYQIHDFFGKCLKQFF